MVVNFNNDSQYRIWEKLGLPRLKLWQIMIIVLLITTIWCLAILGLPLSFDNQKRTEEKLWHRYVNMLARLGVNREPSESPDQFIDRAIAMLPNAANIRSVGDDLVRLRFQRIDSATTARLTNRIRKGLGKLYVHSLLHTRTAKIGSLLN